MTMAAAGSPNLTNDGNDSKEKSTQSFKSASVAANRTVPSAIRTVLLDLKKLGKYYGIYTSLGTRSLLVLKDHIGGNKTNDFIDSLYMCVVTMATVGYGDLYPHATSGAAQCPACGSRKIGPIEALKEIETLNIDYTKCITSLIVMAVHFVIRILVLCTVEKMEFDDAFYCAVSTMTTVGFGDKSFSCAFGRMFGMIWIFTGTSFVCQLCLYMAEVYTDIEAKKFVKWVIAGNVIDRNEIEDADDLEKDKVHGLISALCYFYPFFDGIQYGKYDITQFTPIQEPNFSRYVRSNSMQAVVLDVLLIFPDLLERSFNPKEGLGLDLVMSVDSTVFLFLWSTESVIGVNSVLDIFYKMFGLKLNASKCEGSLWVAWIKCYVLKDKDFWNVNIHSSLSWNLRKLFKLHPKAYPILFIGATTVRAIWVTIREKRPLVPWQKIIWFPLHIPKHILISWMALLDILPTKERLHRMRLINDCKCVFCDEPTETRDYLFLQCSMVDFI
ncbi:Protein TIC 20-v [Hibiscus syriacus]|uniref:Protein TIC 20 n=1 Tax=Hibiscus syriacus TaxID=106335 RepID=A0A6A2Y4Z4_HIBSY|nr:Protein TIC 20-v [Hibiscus syriacus]